MKKLWKKVLLGWCIITITYLICLRFLGLYLSINNLGSYTDHHPTGLNFIVGLSLIIVPYTIAGFYCKNHLKTESLFPSFLVAIIPNIGEKLLVYLLGSIIYKINVLNITELIDRISISGDPIFPYYRPIYLFASIVIGTLLCISIPKIKLKN